MSVDTATVAKIAALARLKVSEGELAAMVPELNGILAWVEQLGEVDVTGIEPMTAVIANHQRLRDDVVNADPLTGGGKRDAVLANAPACERRGEAEVSVRHKVGFYERSEAQVRDELETLARNEAPGVGADSISPLGPPVAGGQSWALWRCGR